MTSTTVPGDPGGIRCAAGVLGETSEDAEVVVTRLKSLNDCSGDSMWRGPAADAFREKLGELPDKLVKLRDSYGIASEALYRFANDVDQLQDEAGNAEQTETWAEDQVDFREREKQDAEACYPDADLRAYDQAILDARQKLCQAEEEVAQVSESYRCAEDRCIASLNDASDAGMKNTVFGTIRECLAFIGTVADYLAAALFVASLIALACGAPHLAAILLLASTVVGVIGALATIGRWALGDEVAASTLAFALVALIPGVGAISKALKAGGAAIRVALPLLKAGVKLRKILPVLKQVIKVPGRGEWVFGTIELSLNAADRFLGPWGPVTSLPGILERIFRDPDAPPDCNWDQLPPSPEETESVPAPDPDGEYPPATPGTPAGQPGGPRAPGEETVPNQPGGSTPPSGPTEPSGTGGPSGQSGPGGQSESSGPSGPGQGPSRPAPSGPTGSGTEVSAPSPGAGGGGADQGMVLPSPAPGGTPPSPGGAAGDPACLAAGGASGEQPVPLPAPGQQPAPGSIAEPQPLPDYDPPVGTGAVGDVVTFTLPDGTLVTIDPPDQPGGSGGDSSTGRGAPDDLERTPPADERGARGGDAWTADDDLSYGDVEAGPDRLGPVGEPISFEGSPTEDGSLTERPSSMGGAGVGFAGGAAPGPQVSSGPPPAPAVTPPGPAPAPAGAPDDVAGPRTTAEVPAQTAMNLASAKPKLPLGSPLLIGGLAAGGLVGGGAAYVITDARHKLRKEEAEELPLPQPVGLRF